MSSCFSSYYTINYLRFHHGSMWARSIQQVQLHPKLLVVRTGSYKARPGIQMSVQVPKDAYDLSIFTVITTSLTSSPAAFLACSRAFWNWYAMSSSTVSVLFSSCWNTGAFLLGSAIIRFTNRFLYSMLCLSSKGFPTILFKLEYVWCGKRLAYFRISTKFCQV